MGDAVYKKIEVVGTSPKSLEQAVRNAIGKAAKSVDDLKWFEVSELRGSIKNGEVEEFQVTVKIGFRLKD